jgi:hypothetical protein
VIYFGFADDANSVVVAVVFNDAGTCNDKTMVRTDHMIPALGIQDIFVDFIYNVIVNEHRHTINMRGAFAINDGGYHQWLHTIAGTKEAQAASIDEERWAGTMGSIKKDSERCFGITKKRFRILHTQSLLHRAKDIDTIFKVIVVVMVLKLMLYQHAFADVDIILFLLLLLLLLPIYLKNKCLYISKTV